MAVYTGGLSTYHVTITAEDVSDIIDSIDYQKTPTYSEARKVKATGIIHQWQYQDFDTVSTAGTIEGQDVTYATAAQPTGDQNANQIFRKKWAVTKTTEAVKIYGRKSEYKRQQKRKIIELKRDMNATIWQGSAAEVTGTSAAARVMQAMPGFVTQTAGQSAILTLAKVNLAVQEVWDNGTDPDTIWCTGTIKGYISGWSITNLTRNVEARTHKVIMRVDVLDTDWGVLEIIADRGMATQSMYVGISDHLRWANLRAPFVQMTPDLGGGPRGFTESEGCIEVGHPNAFSTITGITATA